MFKNSFIPAFVLVSPVLVLRIIKSGGAPTLHYVGTSALEQGTIHTKLKLGNSSLWTYEPFHWVVEKKKR